MNIKSVNHQIMWFQTDTKRVPVIAFCASKRKKVMCLDFHPVHNSLLAVGCHDGTVMVFDVRHKANRPIYSSSIKTGKHTDPVWQVRFVVSSPPTCVTVDLSPCRLCESLLLEKPPSD